MRVHDANKNVKEEERTGTVDDTALVPASLFPYTQLGGDLGGDDDPPAAAAAACAVRTGDGSLDPGRLSVSSVDHEYSDPEYDEPSSSSSSSAASSAPS